MHVQQVHGGANVAGGCRSSQLSLRLQHGNRNWLSKDRICKSTSTKQIVIQGAAAQLISTLLYQASANLNVQDR